MLQMQRTQVPCLLNFGMLSIFFFTSFPHICSRIQSQVGSDVATLSREGSVQPMNIDGAASDRADEIATQSATESMDAMPSEPMYVPISTLEF